MSGKYVLSLGLVLMLMGCAAKSESRAEMEPMSEPASIQYQFAYGFYQTGDLIRALSAALQAVQHSPRNPDAQNLLGLIYFRQGEYAQAETAFKEAVRLDNKMSEAFNNLGTLYYEQGKFADAKAALEAALSNPLYLFPERIYNNLGLVHEGLNNKEEARQSYERAIALRPDYYLPYLNLGEFWLKEKDLPRSKQLLREAARLCPSCSEPKYHLGQALLQEDKMAEAIKLFQAGFEVDPKGYYGQMCRQFLVENGNMKDE